MRNNLFFLILLLTCYLCTSCHKTKGLNPPLGSTPTGDTTQPPSSPVKDKPKDFVLYHLVRYRNTPNNLMPYLHPTAIANEKMLLNGDGSPNINAIKSFAKTCKPHIPVTLDLETWPYSPADKLKNTINDFLSVITAFKSVNVNSPIGFYGVPPKQAYKWSNIDPVSNASGYGNWLSINHALAPIAAKVNIFLPSFYAYDPDTTSWRKMVDATITEIKKYDPHKPVYAYIWPQYHNNSDPYSLQYIDTALWRFQLKVLYDRVDGCIIWTSNKDSQGNFIYWNPNMLWWQTTKSFMVNKELIPPFVLDSLYTIHSGNKVNVHWATSVDTTTNYFIVQHGADTVHFKNISGHIVSNSTHFTENLYQFTDDKQVTGKSYYRLLIEGDKNDTHYSKIISIQ